MEISAHQSFLMDPSSNLPSTLLTFLDKDGRLKQWPAKPKLKLEALKYLALKFENNLKYTEPEINIILKNWHTFNDWPLLRRELFEKGFINRTKDGKQYWLNVSRN